jgi:hypothetical protein
MAKVAAARPAAPSPILAKKIAALRVLPKNAV